LAVVGSGVWAQAASITASSAVSTAYLWWLILANDLVMVESDFVDKKTR